MESFVWQSTYKAFRKHKPIFLLKESNMKLGKCGKGIGKRRCQKLKRNKKCPDENCKGQKIATN